MNKNVWISAAIALALVMGLVAATFGAKNDEDPVTTGNDNGNQNDDGDTGGGDDANKAGTIKVHDEATADPPMRNQPHVDCTFWIEGFDMEDDEGTIVFYAWPPTGDKSVVVPTGAALTWSADSTNTHFLAGPYSLPSGHYHVEVFNAAGHPGKGGQDDGDRDHDIDAEHLAKAKTFWVECAVEGAPPPPQPVCPTVPTAIALTNGDVRLTWGAPEGVDSFVILRAEGDGDLEQVAHVAASVTTWTDTTTEVGVTYTYVINGVFDGRITSGCTEVEVTAIPEFPTLAGATLAGVGAIGAYVALRRR